MSGINYKSQINMSVEPTEDNHLVTKKFVEDAIGQGFPTGGTADQLLAKASNTDFDTKWVTDPPASQLVGLDDRSVQKTPQQYISKSKLAGNVFSEFILSSTVGAATIPGVGSHGQLVTFVPGTNVAVMGYPRQLLYTQNGILLRRTSYSTVNWHAWVRMVDGDFPWRGFSNRGHDNPKQHVYFSRNYPNPRYFQWRAIPNPSWFVRASMHFDINDSDLLPGDSRWHEATYFLDYRHVGTNWRWVKYWGRKPYRKGHSIESRPEEMVSLQEAFAFWRNGVHQPNFFAIDYQFPTLPFHFTNTRLPNKVGAWPVGSSTPGDSAPGHGNRVITAEFLNKRGAYFTGGANELLVRGQTFMDASIPQGYRSFGLGPRVAQHRFHHLTITRTIAYDRQRLGTPAGQLIEVHMRLNKLLNMCLVTVKPYQHTAVFSNET